MYIMSRELSTSTSPDPFVPLYFAMCALFCTFCPLLSCLFSCKYNNQILQLLCFDNVANCPGGHSGGGLKVLLEVSSQGLGRGDKLKRGTIEPRSLCTAQGQPFLFRLWTFDFG